MDEGTQAFTESIFKIFRKFNVLDYKNPHDDLNWRTLYKIVGYANMLIGTAEHDGDVPPDQVTISIFRATKNKALFTEMAQNGMLEETDASGIYEVIGLTPLPFQLVITSELEGVEYAAFRALTDNADETDVEQTLNGFEDIGDETLREYGAIVLDLIAKKNPAIFADVIRSDGMKYAGLMEAFKDDVDERVRTEKVLDIKNLMETLKLNLEQAMDALKIPSDQRSMYAGMVNKKL